MSMNKKYGSVVIASEVLDNFTYEDLKIIFEGFVPLHIKTDMRARITIYQGIHEDFEEQPMYMPDNVYDVVITTYINSKKIIKRAFVKQ